MKVKELLGAFLQGFFRWIGVGVAIFVFFAFIASFSNDTPALKVNALPAGGFEVTPWTGQNAMAVIRIEDAIGSKQLNRERIAQLLEAFQSPSMKGKVKAILLQIDSPGGTAMDSEAIYQLLNRYKELYKIPVHAYIEGYCASGGYLIACASDKIVATEYSVIGSVGVVARLVNYSGTLEKLGMEAIVFSRGEGKNALDPMKPMMESDRAFFEPILTADYGRFLREVSKARPLLTEKVLQQLGARVYSAKEAKDLGYIDEVGFDRSMAIAALASEAALGSNFAVIEVKAIGSFSDMFVESSYQGIESSIKRLMATKWQVYLN